MREDEMPLVALLLGTQRYLTSFAGISYGIVGKIAEHTIDGKYGTNCHSYALYVLSQLTGKKVATAGCNFKRFNKNELWNVSAGDLIRYKSPDNNKQWGHTVIVVSANGNAINITDCNSDNKSTVRWRTIYISEIEKLFYNNGNNYVIKFADWIK